VGRPLTLTLSLKERGWSGRQDGRGQGEGSVWSVGRNAVRGGVSDGMGPGARAAVGSGVEVGSGVPASALPDPGAVDGYGRRRAGGQDMGWGAPMTLKMGGSPIPPD